MSRDPYAGIAGYDAWKTASPDLDGPDEEVEIVWLECSECGAQTDEDGTCIDGSGCSYCGVA